MFTLVGTFREVVRSRAKILLVLKKIGSARNVVLTLGPNVSLYPYRLMAFLRTFQDGCPFSIRSQSCTATAKCPNSSINAEWIFHHSRQKHEKFRFSLPYSKAEEFCWQIFVCFRVLINDTHSCAFSKVNIGAQYEKYTCTCGLHIAVVLGSGTIANLTGNFLKGRIDIYCCCRQLLSSSNGLNGSITNLSPAFKEYASEIPFLTLRY